MKKAAALPTLTTVLSFTILIGLSVKVLGVFRVKGDSMAPTLLEGDLILGAYIAKNSSRLCRVSRKILVTKGSIVVFRSPISPKFHHVKRIRGTSGDYVTWGWNDIRFGSHVLLANQIFLVGAEARSTGDVRGRGLPEHAKQIMFDVPLDSRTYGPVFIDSVLARAFLILWPLNRASILARLTSRPTDVLFSE